MTKVINLCVANGLFLSFRMELCPPGVMKPFKRGERDKFARTNADVLLSILSAAKFFFSQKFVIDPPVFVCSCQGLVYTMTDVEEVHVWMVKHFAEHPLFTPVPVEELVGFSCSLSLKHLFFTSV